MNQYRTTKPRAKVNPPHVSLADLRAALGLTLDTACQRMTEQTGKPFTRGALSAIENGHRGASADTIAALTVAYGLRPEAIRTDYEPRTREDAA